MIIFVTLFWLFVKKGQREIRKFIHSKATFFFSKEMYIYLVNLLKVCFQSKVNVAFLMKLHLLTKVGPKTRVLELDKFLWPTFNIHKVHIF